MLFLGINTSITLLKQPKEHCTTMGLDSDISLQFQNRSTISLFGKQRETGAL